MSLLDLVPQSRVASIEPRGVDEPVPAEQFVERPHVCFRDMERARSKTVSVLEVVAFLPSGKAISVDTMGYENPSLVLLTGWEQDTGKTRRLLADQSSVQVLVSVEPVQPGNSRKVLRFTYEK